MTRKKNSEKVDGTNALAWPHPYERDTTRGSGELPFESLHQDQPRRSLIQDVCNICGGTFFRDPEAKVGDCGVDDTFHNVCRGVAG